MVIERYALGIWSAGLAWAAATAMAAAAPPVFTGPLPYQSIADSPYFAGGTVCYELETFPSGSVSVPGYSFSQATGASIVPGSGVPPDGHVLQASDLGVIELYFDPPVDIAGIVWTGGDPIGSTITVTVIAGPEAISNQYSGLAPNDPSGPADNRFFGVTWDVGIRILRVTFLPFGADVPNQIDHIQFTTASGSDDTDGDGSPDCVDGCPDDLDKTEPGLCGCGVSDVDLDGDGTPDCLEGCVADIDGNGTINGGDLGIQLLDWGTDSARSDIDGNGIVTGADVGLLLIAYGSTCGPVTDSIDPAAGSSVGGTEVTITGRHLAAATSVSIGGSEAEIVSASGDAIVVLTPPGVIGLADLVVTTPFGSMTDAGAFEYLSPVSWATILEASPDPKVVTDLDLLAAIIATGLPWRVRDNASQIEMLLVPPGTFMMGCSPSNQYGCGGSPENPVHEVTLTQPFYLGRYEVTQAQWTAVMGSNPSGFQSPSSQVPAEQVPFRPVEKVSWVMIQGFEAATGLRLPTEAEWEYACRAGTQTAFNLPPNGTNDDGLLGQLAWCNQNNTYQTRLVGQKQANNLGFHDMLGNVWEWAEDWYGIYPSPPQTDPLGPPSGEYRVLRGGSWNSQVYSCRVSSRDGSNPGNDSAVIGFRAARNP